MTALTPAQIAALPVYTNAEMVKLLRYCIAQLASDPNSQVQMAALNRSYTMRDMDQLQRMLRKFEDLAAADAETADAAAGNGAGSASVRFVQQP